MTRYYAFVILTAAVVLLSYVSHRAAGRSSIQGVVTDRVGHGVSGITVWIRQEMQSNLFSTTTDERGEFSFRDVTAGVYVVRVQLNADTATQRRVVASFFKPARIRIGFFRPGDDVNPRHRH